MENTIVVKIGGDLTTNFVGINELFKFYNEAKDYFDCIISIDFYHLRWFDANLSAIFGAMIQLLIDNNNLKFTTDLAYLENRFDVLFRNGFLNSENYKSDERNSTIAFQNFDQKDKESFNHYIENNLMQHRGMPNLSEDQSDSILDALNEIFCNIQLHAQTDNDFFVCGQYYPRQSKLIFTMVDLGIGFLPAIAEKTNNEVQSNYQAIKWALEKRNTTKKNTPGGLGLYDLNNYFSSSNGDFQIITGDTFWSKNLENSPLKKQIFNKPFIGTIVNLVFEI